MALRIVLNDDAGKALKEIASKLKNHEPTLTKFQNALVSLIIVNLKGELTDLEIRRLSEKLVSRTSKRKILINRIVALTDKLDEDKFENLDASLKKVVNQYEKQDLDLKSPVEAFKTPSKN